MEIRKSELKEGLTVSVVVYNPDKEMFQKFINSLVKYTPQLKQLLIYMNDSTVEAESKMTKALFTTKYDVNVHRNNDENTGFGHGHNVNLMLVHYSHFAVLNDDIEFFEDWSTPMMKVLEDEKVGQVCMKRDTCNSISQVGLGYYLKNKKDDPEYAEASCMMMKTILARKFGLFDTETFKFAYFEDTDLSLRIRKLGFKIKNVDVNWKHHRASTTKRINDIDIEGIHINNQYQFRLKWGAYLFKKRFGETIVIKREGSLGDVFLIGSLLPIIKKRYPESVIILMTKASDMMQNNNEIDVIVAPGTPLPCDYLVDLDYSYEKDARVHIIDAYRKEVMKVLYKITVEDFKDQKRLGVLYFSKAARSAANIVLNNRPDIKDGEFVAVNVSDTWPGKQWEFRNYSELAKRIKERTNLKIIYIGVNAHMSKYNLMLNNENMDMSLVNQLDIASTSAILARAAMLVSYGGLLTHVTQAFNLPTVILFGCEKPECGSEEIKTTTTISSSVACQGCRNRISAGTYVECNRDAECMKRISVDEVFEAILVMVDKWYVELKKE